MKLDIACGQRLPEGWVGMDVVPLPGVRFVHDLKSTDPWPLDDASVEEARCHHFFEHLGPAQRVRLMNELWRVLVPGGTAEFVTPHGYYRQVQDPDHAWPPVVPGTYYYFVRRWRDENGLSHYEQLHGIRCDFELVGNPEIGLDQEQFADLGPVARMERALWDPGARTDLRVVLRKKVA